MRLWLALLGALPLLLVGSGGTAAAGASSPPHNGLLATSGSDGLYLADAHSGKVWNLPGTAEMGNPAWSPDGRLLAVESWDDDSTSVYTVKPDGSERRLVLRNAWSPSWSPDGKRLVVARTTCADWDTCAGVSVLFSVAVDGTDLRQVTFDHGNDNDGAGEPAWSPDGKWIAFSQGDGVIRLVSANGESDGVRTIAKEGANPAWSPDGSKLAFDTTDTGRDYRQEIVVVDIATGKRTNLSPRPTPVSAASWSPDGTQIAFLASRPHKALTGCGGELTMDLWVMRADGSKPRRLSKTAVWGHPSWGTFEPAPQSHG